ncbi:hypothetical protein O6H91_07G041900 [Diphasiastrum complanatum]|uniref:Uncharacterized protein n=1 Tax=Diphasiastrum complanatum TaxID=34168 RepID=A0ACC2D4J7_DIPCM|nr:hypothetical protein O6H91_Y397400 [Diphasiastrum complanatum]KAJ7549139.1 hypothetical protein O6H91_07G041900 [Diphasiastrum complanatum]
MGEIAAQSSFNTLLIKMEHFFDELLIQMPDTTNIQKYLAILMMHLAEIWNKARVKVISPSLQLAMTICLVLQVLLFVEVLYMYLAFVYLKLSRYKPEDSYKFEPIKEDQELGDAAYPMILVQIPMYNEREVYKLSIRAVCGLSWPASRFIVQILDDSSDSSTRELIKDECQYWEDKGINVQYEMRDNRNGYKAGALSEGLSHSYAQMCEFVAIFDADFQPDPDFLHRSVPFLVNNPELAFLQARWMFVNSNECIMTRMAEISLNYQFLVEQQVGSTVHEFFSFNGTAGVWRIRAIDDAGGWQHRTTVEDMDLATRAGLQGWKSVYLNDLLVKNELPSTFKAFRNQQHRWYCGPANLFRNILPSILVSRKVTIWKKLHMIYSFFLIRRILAQLVAFTFFCILIPASKLAPEVHVPYWGTIFLPLFLPLIVLNVLLTTPRSLHLMVIWILFENVMTVIRTRAVITGLLGIGRVNEWIVTKKLGTAPKEKRSKSRKRGCCNTGVNIHTPELLIGVYLFGCGCFDLMFGHTHFYMIYLFTQAVAFFVMGFGYVGTFVPY